MFHNNVYNIKDVCGQGMPTPFLFQSGYWTGTFSIQISDKLRHICRVHIRGWDSSVQQNMLLPGGFIATAVFLYNSFGEPKPTVGSTLN